MSDSTDELRARANKIRTEMGGAERVARMATEGKPTIRGHIDALLDEGSFRELGTFSRSLRVEDRATTPGDGKIGGELYEFLAVPRSTDRDDQVPCPAVIHQLLDENLVV